LVEVKLKQLSEDGDRKLSMLKQKIDQQIRLANDNIIKTENKTKDILERDEKAQTRRIQEVKDQTEFKIAQHK
jgi:cell division GTPase FtsZ